MIDSILIPKQRLGVIKDRKEKAFIEEKLKVKLTFEANTVIIDGEGIEAYLAKLIIKAIARGFAPVKAYRLLNDDQQLEIIELKQEQKKMDTIKSRVIGTGGKTREEIEQYTKASVSVYGKTISLIGTFEQITNAKTAIEMLIKGSMHKTVYDFLRRL